MSSDFKFDPLENGLDFIRSGLEHLQGKPDKLDVKYAVLHLSAGIEIVLKERLRREHWSLVFDKAENASKEVFETGTFTSASFRETLRRLREICGVPITDEHCKELLSFRDKRNRLEHFGIADSVPALTASAAKTLSFLIEFIGAHLQPEELNEEDAVLLDEIRQMLSDSDAFVTERLRVIEGKLKSTKTAIVTCTRCRVDAAVLSDGVTCLFCEHRGPAEEGAKEYVQDILRMTYYETIKDGGEWPIHECPECSQDTLVDRGPSGSQYPEKQQFVCFGCGEAWPEGDLDSCSSCGRLYDPSNEFSICNSCFEAKTKAE